MKTACLIGIIGGMGLGSALGNGGGYIRGGVNHTGDVSGFEPQATEHIRILDEKLTVTLGPAAAEVEVRYLMRNETDKKVKVRFGFPVEESFDDNTFGAPDSVKVVKEPKYCQGYRITAGGKAVKAQWQAEPAATPQKAPEVRFVGIAGWLVSELTFTAGEEKPVMIRFTSGYPRTSFYVSENGSTSAAVFRYRLSTAACWAGTIGSGRITLKTAGTDPAELKVLNPVNRFRKQGDAWVWDFENLEPTLADDMQMEVVPEVESHSGDKVLYHRRGNQWYYTTTKYAARASSELAPEGTTTYGPANLRDETASSAWSEGKPGQGAGEWLELRPDEAQPLLAIAMKSGYQKSAELFKANPRPKRIKVILNGEHSFVADIPDVMGAIRIPVKGYSKRVNTLKLVFEEVWPGTHFEDLCVSDIELEVKLAKKPELSPVR